MKNVNEKTYKIMTDDGKMTEYECFSDMVKGIFLLASGKAYRPRSIRNVNDCWGIDMTETGKTTNTSTTTPYPSRYRMLVMGHKVRFHSTAYDLISEVCSYASGKAYELVTSMEFDFGGELHYMVCIRRKK